MVPLVAHAINRLQTGGSLSELMDRTEARTIFDASLLQRGQFPTRP